MSTENTMDTMKARVGEPLNIRLASTPGTGAIWHLASEPANTNVRHEDAEPIGKGVGGPVTQIFVFTAKRAGAYELVFVLKRAWETNVQSRTRVPIVVD